MTLHVPKKIVLFSHDSVGLGHVRRNLALARAFTEAADRDGSGPVTGLLVTGEPVALKFRCLAAGSGSSSPASPSQGRRTELVASTCPSVT